MICDVANGYYMNGVTLFQDKNPFTFLLHLKYFNGFIWFTD